MATKLYLSDRGVAVPSSAPAAATSFQPPLASGVQILNSFAEAEKLQEKWDQVVAEQDGSIHFSFEWCRTWWEFYGGGKDLRIFLLLDAGELKSALVFYVDELGFPPFSIKVARLVCANIPPKAFTPPFPQANGELLARSVLRQLLEIDSCHLLSLGPVTERNGLLAAILHEAEAHPWKPRVTRKISGVHTVFELPGSLDEFFERMDKDERKKRKYELRLLAKDPLVSRDIVSTPGEAEREFHAFERFHALQWSDKGKLGHFGSWPKGKEFNLALTSRMAALNRLRFVRILSQGEVISEQYAFTFGRTCYWELPARALDRKWSRFSLGTSGFFALVEEAIRAGCSRVEAGVAHYDYKQKLGGMERPLETLRIERNSASARVKLAVFRAGRALLGLGYYKLWYARLSPHLPSIFRKPISTMWLRLDA